MECHAAVFFFFQAEDGIRDKLVTGVQTCALPILSVGNENITGGVNRNAIRCTQRHSGCRCAIPVHVSGGTPNARFDLEWPLDTRLPSNGSKPWEIACDGADQTSCVYLSNPAIKSV